ncbi:MAG: metallophosphoesterase, partial [Rhodothermales bacterium]|nr:metallophosphoesterase [Rhodothermales bacterium]
WRAAEVVGVVGPVWQSGFSPADIRREEGPLVNGERTRGRPGFLYVPYTQPASAYGPRDVDFTLSDGDGGTSATYSTTVAVSAGVPQVFEVRVVGTENDAEQRVSSGSMYLTSSDLEFTFDGTTQQIVGMRFMGIEVPQGATITNAYIQFQVDETGSAPTSLIIQGEATSDAQQFTSSSGNISSRSLTTASVAWLPAPWTTVGAAGSDQQTPNISGIIQEIVSQADWASGNSLVIVITGTGTRTAESYDGVSSAAPLLHIEYSYVDDGTPRIDLDADNSSGANANDYRATYFVDSGPIAIADVDVQISDSNDLQLASAHIQLINPELGDRLLSGAFPGGISLDPSSTQTELILTGNASLADYATAIKGITFENTEIGPTPGARTIEVTVNDGTSDSAIATSTVTVASGSTISFWVIADTPYGATQLNALNGYIASIPQDAEFIVHLGDIKSGSGDLTQSIADTVANALLASSVPVFIIPGDNEYNDTPNPDASWAIWEATFLHFDQNWQHNLSVSYQPGREENFAFVSDGVLFIGINLVGGSVHDAQEFADRSADDLAWIDTNFALFGDEVTSAIIFGHASPTKSVYNDFENGFVMEAQQFDKPILYLMGDNHNWSLSHPWADAPNITRIVLEQTGATSDSDPLLVTVSSDPDQPFTYDHDFGLIA